MNYKPNETRLSHDSCSYTEKLKRTIGPGLYALDTPYNDCTNCPKTLPDDPALRFQSYGPNTCTAGTSVDDSSELLGLNYRKTKCNGSDYVPGKYKSNGACAVGSTKNPRECLVPREDTRLSNDVSTLRATGINRWEWLCCDPQERAIEKFDRIPVNYRMVAKDNHVPIIETPMDQSQFFPSLNSLTDSAKWQRGTAQDLYAPGNPYGAINYNANTCGTRARVA